MIGIVCSMTDSAGKNLHDKIKEKFGGANSDGEFFLIPIEVHGPLIEKLPKADAYIFASRHVSESGKPTLCVHAPGNWSAAALGGNPRELAWTDSRLMKSMLIELKKEQEKRKLNYEVTMECTHHGPTHFGKPCMFIEVGSSEKQYNDPEAVDAVATALLRAPKVDWTPCVGFGGGHYPIRMTQIQLKTEYAIGHIIPKYENADFEMIKQAVEKCRAEKMIIDWKGTNQEQHLLIEEAAEKLGLELLRAKKLVK
jgi:D-aminoacyl-tRNA deacylase